MIKRLWPLISFPFLLLILSSCNKKSEISIIPLPVKMEVNHGHFTIQSGTRLYCSNSTSEPAALLKDYLQKLTGMSVTIDSGINSKSKAIFLEIDSTLGNTSAYTLDVTSRHIIITGKDPAGVFYGIQSLLQILSDTKGGRVKVPSVKIYDYPRFAWRGMHLDVSRHFFSKDEIFKYLDILAAYKLNVFHWHLVDDQGWRIEIRKYPKLTSLAAYRIDQRSKPWNADQIITNDTSQKLYGGYYTREDVKEIVKYAADRFITIIPEIEMPGHSRAALTAYPQFSCSGKPYHKPADVAWEFTDPYCAGNDSTYIFLKDILSEIIDLFPSPYIHIGGDEAKKTPWEKCPKCQRKIRSEKLANTEALQGYFMKQIADFLVSKNKIPVVWDEILDADLPATTIIMSWRDENGGIEAAQKGYDAVMTPNQLTYFNYHQDSNGFEGQAEEGFIGLQSVYNYEPVPAVLTTDQEKLILGVEGCLWTEYIQTPERIENRILPRLAALAEVMWSQKSGKDWNNFLKRLNENFDYLNKRGIGYFIPTPLGIKTRNLFTGTFKVKLINPYPFGEIRYTTDGSDPSLKSKKYSYPFTLKKNTVLKTRLFLPNGKSGATFIAEIIKVDPKESNYKGVRGAQGIHYTYLTGKISTLSDFGKLVSQSKGIAKTFVLPASRDSDFFGLEFNGLIDIQETGIYNFSTNSDDGSDLYIDNQCVVYNDGIHGNKTVEGQIALKKGLHTVRLRYFDYNMAEELQVFMEGPGMQKQEIPAARLFCGGEI